VEVGGCFVGFFEEVYEVVRKIPKGKVATYGQIAKIMGQPRRAKIVGWALHKNPYFGDVPCHRVVNRNGEITSGFAFGGLDEQRRMLEAEGIIFNEDGKINLDEYLWEL
jgi:methylated-DNA-protein-cysteine methyltransferase-like protein